MDLHRATAFSVLLLAGCFGDIELQKPQDPPAWPMGQPRERAERDVPPAETPPPVAPVEPVVPVEPPKDEVPNKPVQPAPTPPVP